MSFLSILETIGKDVLAGIAVAAPVIGEFVPKAGPILAEVATIISDLEGATTPTTAQTSALVQATATASAVKQAIAATPAPATPATAP
jgi:hypothetical protein